MPEGRFRRATAGGAPTVGPGASDDTPTAGDWAAIWPIWHEIVGTGDTYAYDPATSSDEARAMWLDAPAGETWLLEDGGAVLGAYRLAPNHGGPGAHIANASYMVPASARGRGIGRALVEHSIVRARAAGYLGLQFNAVAATNVHAIRLYHELGFRTVGTIPKGFRHPADGLVDLLVMYREL
jgi:ribosomal protein S18 acetylase RimI-like enzyme